MFLGPSGKNLSQTALGLAANMSHFLQQLIRVALGAVSCLSLALAPTIYNTTGARAQSIPYWAKDCQKLYTEYKGRPGHKAFAVFADQSVESGCAYTYRAGSKQQAEKQAIQQCGKVRPGTFMGSGISRRCVVYKSE